VSFRFRSTRLSCADTARQSSGPNSLLVGVAPARELSAGKGIAPVFGAAASPIGYKGAGDGLSTYLVEGDAGAGLSLFLGSQINGLTPARSRSMLKGVTSRRRRSAPGVPP